MKPVATWSFDPWFQKTYWKDTQLMVASMRASILSINEFFSKPKIYTDTLTKDVIDHLELNCDVVVAYDNIYQKDNVDLKFWMYTKLLTYQQQKESYFHFDFDFIVHKKIDESYFDTDLSFQHLEEYPNGQVYLQHTDYEIFLPEIFYRYDLTKVLYPNLGFLYFRDMNLNQEYCNLAIEMVKRNSTYKFELPKNLFVNCIVEQQLLGLMIKERSKNYKTFINHRDKSINENFHHYFNNLKNSPIARQNLSPYINRKVIDVAKYLQHLKSQQKN